MINKPPAKAGGLIGEAVCRSNLWRERSRLRYSVHPFLPVYLGSFHHTVSDGFTRLFGLVYPFAGTSNPVSILGTVNRIQPTQVSRQALVSFAVS